ncbi:MAG: YeeE/YedE family protein [Polyangiaceae bacterium]
MGGRADGCAVSARLAWLSAIGSGALFGVGLTVAGMTRPEKVVAFLDITSDRWDPSLALVMVGAIAVYAIALRVIRRLRAPLFARTFSEPEKTGVDVRLVAGAAIFGLGWGLAGYCPGPALAAVTTPSAAVFVATMVVGFYLHRAFASAARDRDEAPAQRIARG